MGGILQPLTKTLQETVRRLTVEDSGTMDTGTTMRATTPTPTACTNTGMWEQRTQGSCGSPGKVTTTL